MHLTNEVLIFNEVQLFNFFLFQFYFLLFLGKLCAHQDNENMLLWLCQKALLFSHLISNIIEIFCGYSVLYEVKISGVFCFSYLMKSQFIPQFKKTILSLVHCSVTFVMNQLPIYIWIYFWILYSVSFICWFILVPLPCTLLSYCNF